MRRALFTAALAQVDASIHALDQQLMLLDAAQSGDTKSSAGDKFETSREMMAQRREVLQAQKQIQVDHRLKLELALRKQHADRIVGGSSVTLSTGQQLIICTGLGKVKLENGKQLFVISMQSPLGKTLMGKSEGDKILLAGKQVSIESVA